MSHIVFSESSFILMENYLQSVMLTHRKRGIFLVLYNMECLVIPIWLLLMRSLNVKYVVEALKLKKS
jgi:hypothetical protein